MEADGSDGDKSPVYAFLDPVLFPVDDDEDHDPSYIPDSCSESDDELDFIAVGLQLQPSVNENILKEQQNVSSNPAGHAKGKIAGTVVNTGKGKLDKLHYCIFCGIPQSKLSRHLASKHKNERDLIPYLIATGKEKQKELAKLRHGGDHLHNIKVLKEGEGTVVIKRKKRQDVDINDFVPCHRCLGYFSKRDLWRHKCLSPGEEEGPKRQLVRKGRFLLPSTCGESPLFRSILETMRPDEVSVAIRNDFVIKMMGERQCKRNGHDRDRHSFIRNKLRELGRLLIAIRKIAGKETGGLIDFLKPAYFRTIVQATMDVASYESGSFANPSLAMKLGHSLKQCCLLLKAFGIEKGDQQLKEDCEGYMEMHSISWNEEISNVACRVLYQNKKNKVKRLPLVEDVTLLSQHLARESDTAKEKLRSSHTHQWSRLAQTTLCQVILFNRRRQGEASKMKLEDYVQGQANSHSEDILSSLSNFEKALCNTLSRIEITGKRGRTVPVILTASMKEAIDLLIERREEAGVSSENQFVFACTNYQSEGHIRGSDCLRNIMKEISLKQPELITSTALRKQIATMTQLLNLRDNELDILAQFMGHDIRIHREHYRLPSSTLQVAKVSKLLLAMEKGNVAWDKESEIEPDDIIEEDETETVTSDISSDESGEGHDQSVVQNSKNPRPRRKFKRKKTSDSPPFKELTELAEFGKQGMAHKSNAPSSSTSTLESSKRGYRNMSGRKNWTDEEADACLRNFSHYTALASLPGKSEILRVKETEPKLENRTWIQIKNFVRNHIKKSSQGHK